nr:uncharacterized protein LOC113813800 [Penaeus vannamei]
MSLTLLVRDKEALKPQLNNILGVYGRLPQKRNQKVIRLGIQEEASQLPSRIPDAMRFKGYDHRFLQVSSKGTVRLVRKVFNQYVLPVVTHGSETWTTTKLLESKLRSAQRGMERPMLGISLRDRTRVTWIREQTKVKDILGSIKEKK